MSMRNALERSMRELMMQGKYGEYYIPVTYEEDGISVEVAKKLYEMAKATASFTEASDSHVTTKQQRAAKRKADFKAIRRAKTNATYKRSGLDETERGAVHSRKGDIYGRREKGAISDRELRAMIDEALNPVVEIDPAEEAWYKEYLAYHNRVLERALYEEYERFEDPDYGNLPYDEDWGDYAV